MSFKDILVHVDATAHSDGRVALAAEMARRHGAHLTGLYAVAPEQVNPVGPSEAKYGASAALAASRSHPAAERAKAHFDETIERAGIKGEWRMVTGLAEEAVPLHARCADLVIVGQSDPDDKTDAGSLVAARTVLTSGRPVLAVPYAGKYESIGANVVVAWNDTAEAARALNDALPILARADSVTVLAVNPHGAPAEAGGTGGAADIALHLARHGVKAQAARIETHEISVGDMILNRAFDLGADLLVTGAYGHSQLREAIFGGVTRALFDHMTVPVFLSH